MTTETENSNIISSSAKNFQPLFCHKKLAQKFDFVETDLSFNVLLRREKTVDAVVLNKSQIFSNLGDLGYHLDLASDRLYVKFPNGKSITVAYAGPMVLKLFSKQAIVEEKNIDQDVTEKVIHATFSAKEGNALGVILHIIDENNEKITPNIKGCREIELFLTVPLSSTSVQSGWGGVSTSSDRQLYQFNENI